MLPELDLKKARSYARWGSPICMIRAHHFPLAPPASALRREGLSLTRAGLAVLLWQGWLYFDSIAHMCALICAVIIGLVRSSALRSCPSQLSIAAASSARSAAARSASSAAAHVC